MNKRIVLIVMCVALLVTSCGLGSGRVVTSERSVSGFDAVVLEGLGELTITQGDEESLTIEAESNVMRRITTEVRGRTLYIGLQSAWFGISIVPTKPIRYDLTMSDIRTLDVTGLGSIYAGEVRTGQLDVDMSGAGEIVIRSLDADTLELSLGGLGACEVAGEVREQDILLTGGGDYNGRDLESDKADITLTGLGKAVVWATESLDIELTGAGSVEYYGSPRVTQNVSGLGRVKSLGPR